MRNTALTLFALFMFAITCIAQTDITANMPAEIEPITAPFDMPQLQRPVFPARKLTVKRSSDIQRHIDKLAAKGGGTVVIPKGKWNTGRIIMKSNICLYLEEGCELLFSGDVKDYMPSVACRNEGVDIFGPGAMIYANDVENIALTGKGKLIAPERKCELLQLTMGGIPEEVQQMPLEERVFDGSKGKGSLCLPVFFGPMHSKNILVEGVTFERSVFWNIVPVYCENIIIRGVSVRSGGIARTDGIDIDSSINALIEYTYLDCGDDCFTLKAGRGMDGLQKARPTRNVVIRHCYADRGAGGLTIGSETAAGVQNVYMKDVTIDQPKYGIYFKTRRPRGGGGENMWFEDVRMLKPKTRAIYWDMLGGAIYVGKWAERYPSSSTPEEEKLYGKTLDRGGVSGGVLTPSFKNIFFKNVSVEECPDFIKALGLPESPIDNVEFINVTSKSNKKVTLQDTGKVVFE